MLLEWFPKLRESKTINIIKKFLYSKYYIIMFGVMTFLCHLFGFEIPYYYGVVLVSVTLPALICDDFLPIIAPLAMTYSSVSLKSNNTRFKTSLFGGDKVIHMYILIGLIVLSLLPKLIYDIIKKPERRRIPALLWGFAILGPCYALGGVFTPYWKQDTILYGLVNFLSISGCYFILLYAIDWKKVSKDYFFWVMTVYGLAVAFEVVYMLIEIKTGNTSFISWRGHLFTGWGMRNNIAGQICLCVAAPIYLAYKHEKWSWLFMLFSIIMVVGCGLTNSRGGLLTAILFLVVALVIYFRYANKKQRYTGLIVLGTCVIGLTVFSIIKRDTVTELLSRFFNEELSIDDPTSFTQGRNVTWSHGIEHFLENELTGVGFFQCKDFIFYNFSTGFIPPRYHNIYIQYLASTGLMGLTAYFVHRYQTLKMTFKKPTLEKSFIYLSIAALIFGSLFDNHFFNLGPGLNYCIALAFIEGINIQMEENN